MAEEDLSKLEKELQHTLARMSLRQAAHWVLQLILKHAHAARLRCWWNPVALAAIDCLERKSKRVLERIASGKVEQIEATLRDLEKARRLADGLWATRILGKSILVNAWCIYGLLSQFQCAYESSWDREPDYTAVLLKQMAADVKKYGGQSIAGPKDYTLEALRCAKMALEAGMK